MDLKVSILVVFAACYVYLATAQGNRYPTTISNCYQNTTAYNRYTRQPMHIENLIAIIRKIEDRTELMWDNRRIARAIIHQFQYDGLQYDSNRNYGYELDQIPVEGAFQGIVRDILPGIEPLREGILDNDELCALHWMLSHSINATMRDDEVQTMRGVLSARLTDAKYSNADGRDIEHLEWDDPKVTDGQKFQQQRASVETKKPLETGVVYTRWGPIAAGRLMGGIAAGLEPQSMQVTVTQGGFSSGNGYVPLMPGSNGNAGPSSFTPDASATGGQWNRFGSPQAPGNSAGSSGSQYPRRSKRQTSGATLPPLQNTFAATLAGDIGQAALLNAVYRTPSERYNPPTGEFNDTICPREYVLHALPDSSHDVSHDHDSWSFMTAAEIRGGMDGLILGSQMVNWQRYNYRLSEILEMYYSEIGVVGEYNYRACNRNSVFSNNINPTELLNQAKSFAYVYNNRTSSLTVATGVDVQFLYYLVEQTNQKLHTTIGTFPGIDGGCVRREASSQELSDQDKVVVPKMTVWAVLDQTDTNVTNQLRFLAQLGFEIEVSPHGSRLGVFGSSGLPLLKPNNTANPSTLACDLISQRVFTQSGTNIVATLRALKDEIQRLKDEEERIDYADENGIVVLVFNQGTLFSEDVQTELRQVIKEYRDTLGDVQVMFATSKFQTQDYERVVQNLDFDVIRIQNAVDLSTQANRFALELVQKTHARIAYPRCNKDRYDQSREHLLPHNMFVSPNTVHYYQIAPDYFYSSKKLQMRFASNNGKARICVSRSNPFPSIQNDDINQTNEKKKLVNCKETTGNSLPPSSDPNNSGSNSGYTEFEFDKPCGGGGKRENCGPVYVSVTPTSTNVAAGAVGLDCARDGCQYPDQVQVMFTHYDMRCNGASGVVVSLTTMMIVVLASFRAWL